MTTRRRRGIGRPRSAVAALILALVLTIGGTLFGQHETQAAVFTKPTNSSPIAISSDNALVWSVNPGAATVSVIRTSTHTVIATIAVAAEPRSVALDPNNVFAYVASPATNQVTVIKISNANPASFAAAVDTTAGVNGKITTGAEPWDIVISPDGKRVFVSNSGQDTITVINATGNTVIGNIDLANSVCNDPDRTRQFQPRGMAVTLDNTRLFVTRFLSFVEPGGIQGTDAGKAGGVCRLNINTASTLINDYQPAILYRLQPSITGFKIDSTVPPDGIVDDTSAYPNQLQNIVIRGARAFLPNIAASPSGPLKFNVDTQAFLSQLSGATGPNPVDGGSLNLHLGARTPEPGKLTLFFANPWGIAFTNQTGAGNAYVVSAGSDLLVKLNVDAADNVAFTVNGTTTRYIDLNDPTNAATSGANAGKNPLGIVINNSANVAYVMNFVSRNVSVVNLTTDTVIAVVSTAALPASGSQGERNLVGAEMFFSSRGVFNGGKVNRLSQDGWQNCASCHFDGWTDGNVWTFNTGPRKSIPLNGTFDPNDPTTHQRVLNYSAIFDEVQDFEGNIRNVSGPGALAAPVNGTTNDANHGLLIGDDGNINNAPITVNAFALPNAGRQQLTVTLPGSATTVPALDALQQWVQFAVRTPNGRLTTDALAAGGGNVTGGLVAADVAAGRTLFQSAGCNECHFGGQWTVSRKDFISPPPAAQIFTETTPPAVTGNPVGAQYLDRFLRNIGSFNLGVAGSGNPIGNNIGAVEKATGNVQDGLGFDFNRDGHGTGFNVPSLLGIFLTPPYYHNGSCETLACVLSNVRHRTANNTRPDVLQSPTDQAKVVAFLQTIDKNTVTVTLAGPVPSVCQPRPNVGVKVTGIGGGRLQVVVSSSTQPATPNNSLVTVSFGSVANAVVEAAGGVPPSPPPPGATIYTFFIRRTGPGAVTVPFVVTDTCGEWRTFAGGGPTAF